MGSSEINKENIITATMEELTEEERKAYLLVEEHVKAQFLKGFKKDRGGLVKRVEEFVLPSLKLNQDKIEEIPNVSLSPSDMFDMMSSLMDQKIIAAQAATGDMLVKLSSDVDALRGKQPMSDPNSSDPSSATPEFTSEPLYGMPPNSFSGQTPPPSTVHTAPVRPVRPVRPVTRPVRPVTQCRRRRLSRQFQVRLPLAELMNCHFIHRPALLL